MTIDTNKTLNKVMKTEQDKTQVFEALASASALYERYVEIIDVANIAAFQQTLQVRDVHTAPPLGLVIWPLK